MAWNEPGGNKPKDPWGGGGGGGDQRPPDLDEALKNLKDRINSLFGGKGNGGRGGGGGSRGSKGLPGGVLIVALVILVVGYCLMGFYQVDQSQRAVVLRFGKFDRLVEPGLHWRAPIIENAMKVDVGQNRNYKLKSEMLTQDTNIVSVAMNVQYKVVDPKAYLLRVARPEVILQHATSSSLRRVVGSSTMDDVLKDRREEIRAEVRKDLQNYLDRFNTGLVTTQVVLDETAPPDPVADAFDDVAKAKEDEDRFKKEADAYFNSVIPGARGKAARIRQQAQAYKAKVVSEAQGDAARFTELLVAYHKAPDVTRKRLYLDTLTEMFENTSKVLIDSDGNSNSLFYLPLDKILENRQGKKSGSSTNSSSKAKGGSGSSTGSSQTQQQSNSQYGGYTSNTSSGYNSGSYNGNSMGSR